MNFSRVIDVVVCRQILTLAAPLILSMTASLIMQFVDGIFLSWHSPEAIAAVGPAGMAAFLIGSFFSGPAAYTSTLTAQYHGAGRPDRIGATTWQGIHFSIVAGALVASVALASPLIFSRFGHGELVQHYEAVYFGIMCLGTPFGLLGSTISGFFIGRGDTRTPMAAQLVAISLNAVLAYALVFGHFGLPAWGVAGAAIATVISQAVAVVILCFSFLRPVHRRNYGVSTSWRFDPDLMMRLIRFGLPSGFRIAIEICAWMIFLFFVGRIGTPELASTSIAWRINGFAFFPIIGLSEAVRTLVGQAQGRRSPGESRHIAWQGLLVSEVWMVFAALLFVLFPRELYGLFQGPEAADSFKVIGETGVVLLRFVAVYCLLDAFNIVLQGALQAAGDTKWTFAVSASLHVCFLLSLVAADWLGVGLYGEWAMATTFVMGLAVVWFARFLTNAWCNIQVIEHEPVLSRAEDTPP